MPGCFLRCLLQLYGRGEGNCPRLLEGDALSLAQHEVLPGDEIRVVRQGVVDDDDDMVDLLGKDVGELEQISRKGLRCDSRVVLLHLPGTLQGGKGNWGRMHQHGRRVQRPADLGEISLLMPSRDGGWCSIFLACRHFGVLLQCCEELQEGPCRSPHSVHLGTS